ncbi:MAG: penicillin-binding protein 2 [Hyphomicrobiaceae bacterium]
METAEARLTRRMTRRAMLIGGAQAGVLGFLALKLYDVQVVYGRRYALLADENRIDVQLLPARRGEIRDRNGVVLAESREDLRVTIVPATAGRIEVTLDRLRKLIDITDQEREEILALAGKVGRFQPIVVRRGLNWETFAHINVQLPQLPGVETSIGWRRAYWRGSDVGHIVGYVGRADRREIADAPVRRLPDQRVGKSGLELGMESELAGSPGVIRREVDARGRVVRELAREAPRAGRDLVLTIDSTLQGKVLERLRKVGLGAVVALDATSGDVLTMASTPTFDTQRLAEGISADEWRELVNEPGHPLASKATRGEYPPASTFKLVTALAGLEARVVDPTTVITCRGSIEHGGHRFGCWASGGHGPVRLHEALKHSCDVYFYTVARKLGINRLAEMSHQLGLGQTYPCGLADLRPGLVPDPLWKLALKNKPWYGGETLLAGIGQGFVLATPLQLAVMTARVATGREVVPRLVKADPMALARPRLMPVKAAWLKAIRRGLEGVVNEPGGTANGAALMGVSARLAGKTGTAQVARLGSYSGADEPPGNLRDHSLFVGYAPAEAPRFAVAAVVEHGGAGSKTAAPLVRDVMRDLFVQFVPELVAQPVLMDPSPSTDQSRGG